MLPIACSGFPFPIKLEALSVPFNNCIGFDDDQDFPPIFPEFRKENPKESIAPTKLWPFGASVENGELLAKRKNFRSETQSGRNQAADHVEEN
jgi:hypothetical protein